MLTPFEQHPCKVSKGWSRIEMLLYGGTAWFSITNALYLVNTGLLMLLLGEFPGCPPWVGALQVFAGIFMMFGLFWRPCWRGASWILATGLGVFSEILYAAQVHQSLNVLLFSDEMLFILFVSFGFFRAIFDTLVKREINKVCAHSPYANELPRIK